MKTKLVKNAFLCLMMFFDIKKHQAQAIVGKPPDYGQIALHLPNCTATRPSGSVFTLEMAVVWQPTIGRQPILTTELGYYSLSVVDSGRIQWSFRPRKGNLNAFFETVQMPLADGKRHIVQLIHGAKDCAFLIDERPVKGRWLDWFEPSAIRRDTSQWYVGASVEGDFFNGYLQNFRLFDADVRAFSAIKNGQKRDSAAAKKLLFDFWLDDWNPTEGAENSVSIDSRIRPDEPCGWASVMRKPGVELLKSLSKRESAITQSDDVGSKKVNKMLGLVLIALIVLAMTSMIFAGQSSAKKAAVLVGANGQLMLEEIPAELAGDLKKEEIGFVIRNTLPIPMARVVSLAFTAFASVFLLQWNWLNAFEKAMSDDAATQTSGTLQLLFLGIGTAVFLTFWMWKDGFWLGDLFGGRSYYIGMLDRLLLVDPTRGLFRPIFWEQIRVAELQKDGMIRLELRTLAFDRKFESAMPETLFLSGFKGEGSKIFKFIERQIKAFPIPIDGPDAHITFGAIDSDHYQRADFSDFLAYKYIVFAAKGPFGQKPFLLLRSRIEKATVEPYDLPKSGWLLVVELKNGARQPIAFFSELQFARSAQDFLNRS